MLAFFFFFLKKKIEIEIRNDRGGHQKDMREEAKEGEEVRRKKKKSVHRVQSFARDLEAEDGCNKSTSTQTDSPTTAKE